MANKYAFPDANLFRHFRPLDEIDWLSELKADEVKLVIAPIIIRELDRQKDSAGNKRLRTRAAQAIKRLDAYSSSPMLRQGVEVQFQTADPQIDFARHKLSLQIADDWLVASALEFAVDHNHVCIVSNDLGLRMKLKAHNIPAFKLADEYQLPEEPDPDQKTIAELRDELRTLKDRLPDIKLAFADGQDRLHIALTRNTPVARTELDITMQNLRIRFPKQLKRDRYSGADLMSGAVASPAATDAYNAKLDQFYSEVLGYLRDYEALVDTQHRRFCLELSLINAGTALAEDIDISLHFPHDFEVLQQPELPQPPVQPEPPALPGSHDVPTSIDSAELLRSMPPMVAAQVPGRSVSWNPSLRKSDAGDVWLNVKEVKHRKSKLLGMLYVGFRSWQQVRSFPISYSLLARNLPKPVEGRLNVIVKVNED
jgi:rRNA-processing protein FCF1